MVLRLLVLGLVKDDVLFRDDTGLTGNDGIYEVLIGQGLKIADIYDVLARKAATLGFSGFTGQIYDSTGCICADRKISSVSFGRCSLKSRGSKILLSRIKLDNVIRDNCCIRVKQDRSRAYRTECGYNNCRCQNKTDPRFFLLCRAKSCDSALFLI